MIISIGSLARMYMTDMSKLYPRLRKAVRTYTILTLAIIQHTNADRQEATDPINPSVTFEGARDFADRGLISLMSKTEKGCLLHERRETRGDMAAPTVLLVDESPVDLAVCCTRMVELTHFGSTSLAKR